VTLPQPNAAFAGHRQIEWMFAGDGDMPHRGLNHLRECRLKGQRL
jgi:hypothetical protein